MALTPFTGTITAAQLRANFDDKTSTLAANAILKAKDHSPTFVVGALVPGTALVSRSILFTPQDDSELRYLMHHGSADAAARTMTTTLTVANGDALFIGNQTITLASTSAGAGAFDGRTDYTILTGPRVRLLRGVQYQLAIAVDAGTITEAQALVELYSPRRRS